MTDTVTISAQAVAFLIADALNHLYHAERCCPQCCAPCVALKELDDGGELDKLFGVYMGVVGGEHEIWHGDHINRDWLEQAWSKTDCHEGGDNDET